MGNAMLKVVGAVLRKSRQTAPLLAWVWMTLACALVSGQERLALEYDPYRVAIWVAAEPSPLLPVSMGDTLARSLTAQSRQVFQHVWQVEGKACAPTLARRIAVSPEATELDALVAVDKSILNLDKLFLVGCRPQGGLVRVSVRELDCRSRTFGNVVYRDAVPPSQVAAAAQSALVEAFSPIVRIEMVDGNKAVTRLRAGGLLTSDDSPAAIAPGEILQPVLRRNDRSGEPRAGGIQRLPYTYLEVDQRDGFRVECTVHSGVRGAIGGRSGRIERMALRVRPQERGTRMVLQSRGEQPQPLIGYEVLVRLPASKDQPQLLGLTDQHGEIHLPPGEEPVQMVYVRHGRTMLARIPVVPGLVEEQTLSLTNDDLRLAAESYFLAMQNTVMDLVAQREVLAARIRLHIDEQELDDAQKLLGELRSLASRSELLQQVEQQQMRFTSEDKAVQNKVDRLFAEIRKLLGKHLDPKLVDQVTAELSAARKSA